MSYPKIYFGLRADWRTDFKSLHSLFVWGETLETRQLVTFENQHGRVIVGILPIHATLGAYRFPGFLSWSPKIRRPSRLTPCQVMLKLDKQHSSFFFRIHRPHTCTFVRPLRSQPLCSICLLGSSLAQQPRFNCPLPESKQSVWMADPSCDGHVLFFISLSDLQNFALWLCSWSNMDAFIRRVGSSRVGDKSFIGQERSSEARGYRGWFNRSAFRATFSCHLRRSSWLEIW